MQLPVNHYLSEITENDTFSQIDTAIEILAKIDDVMHVKEQPKPVQRVRYASDGPRFLPNSRRHPVSIQVCCDILINIFKQSDLLLILTSCHHCRQYRQMQITRLALS